MSTFNELLHTLKEVCDEKDKRIEFLEGRIKGLNKQYSLVKLTLPLTVLFNIELSIIANNTLLLVNLNICNI